MPEVKGREHFIPLRRDELVEWLCADDTLTPDDKDQFRRFCRQLAAASHFRLTRRFEELNKAYDPFDRAWIPERNDADLMGFNDGSAFQEVREVIVEARAIAQAELDAKHVRRTTKLTPRARNASFGHAFVVAELAARPLLSISAFRAKSNIDVG